MTARGVKRAVADAWAWLRYRFDKGPPHQRLGRLGERLAANLLRAEGCRIVSRNQKISGHEVDIIAAEGDVLVFVEVKTRSGGGFGKPEEAVNRRRQKRLKAAGWMYLARLGRPASLRFDVVSVDFSRNPRGELTLIRNAF